MCRPRIDLVIKAAVSHYGGDFEWINDRTQLRVGSDPRNQGFSAVLIRTLAKAWVAGGGEVQCTEEQRENWRDLRDYYYWMVIEGIDEFPRGLFVEMVLTDDDEEDPVVHLVNAHPSSFR